jgi:predicted phage-related endonuclease
MQAKIERYLKLLHYHQLIQKELEKLKKEIIEEIESETTIVGNYIVKVDYITQHRLNTKKAKEFLEQIGELEKFLQPTKLTKLTIKKLEG